MSTPGPHLARRRYRAAAIIAVLMVVYFNLLPFGFRAMPVGEAMGRFLPMLLYNPASAGLSAWVRWLAYGAQFAVVAFLVMGALCLDGSRRSMRRAAALVAVLGFVTAGAFEFVQLYFPPRSVSANDLVVQALGAAAGVLGWCVAGQPVTDRLRRSRQPVGMSRITWAALGIYLALIAVYATRPFDFGGPEVIGRKFREGRLIAVPFLDEQSQLELVIWTRRIVQPAGSPGPSPP